MGGDFYTPCVFFGFSYDGGLNEALQKTSCTKGCWDTDKTEGESEWCDQCEKIQNFHKGKVTRRLEPFLQKEGTTAEIYTYAAEAYSRWENAGREVVDLYREICFGWNVTAALGKGYEELGRVLAQCDIEGLRKAAAKLGIDLKGEAKLILGVYL